MPTAHWQFASYDVAFSPFQIMPHLEIVIPATATMKRMLIAGCSISGFASGNNVNRVCSLWINFTIDIVAGQYFPRNIYETSRRIPTQVVGFHDFATLERIYTVSAQANDNELGVNEKCSYGTTTGPGMTVRLSSYINNFPTGFGFPAGRAVVVFRALHILP